MTNESLIDFVCRWLDFNQRKYIVTDRGEPYASGACQTDLRAFLMSIKDVPEGDPYVTAKIFDKLKEESENKRRS